MQLLLMRHTDAVDSTASDFDRILSGRGRNQAEKMGDKLVELDMRPDRIFSSPYPRARETAKLVASRWGEKATAVQVDDRLASGMTVAAASAFVHEMGNADGMFMLVGHAPDMNHFAAHLIGADEYGITMAKGALALFRAERSGRGGATLQWLINPSLV